MARRGVSYWYSLEGSNKCAEWAARKPKTDNQCGIYGLLCTAVGIFSTKPSTTQLKIHETAKNTLQILVQTQTIRERKKEQEPGQGAGQRQRQTEGLVFVRVPGAYVLSARRSRAHWHTEPCFIAEASLITELRVFRGRSLLRRVFVFPTTNEVLLLL